MKTTAVLSIVALCAGLACAQEFLEPPPPEPPPEMPPKEAPPPPSINSPTNPEAALAAEEASGSEQGSLLRDPFWPVGYVPEGAVVDGADTTKDEPQGGTPQWEEAMKRLHLTGIMKTGQEGFVAIVNGQAVAEGDTISVFFSGRNYTWKVRTISPKNVDFAQLNVQ